MTQRTVEGCATASYPTAQLSRQSTPQPAQRPKRIPTTRIPASKTYALYILLFLIEEDALLRESPQKVHLLSIPFFKPFEALAHD
jgi:hypothetical protein